MPVSSQLIDKLHALALDGLPEGSDVEDLRSCLTALGIDPRSSTGDQVLWRALAATHLLTKAQKPAVLPPGEPIMEAPAEQASFCHPKAGQLLVDALENHHWKIVREGLLLLKATKMLLHPVALPAVLDQASSRHDLWSLLAPTLGARAQWLAAQNPDWHWWRDAHLRPEDEGNPSIHRWIWGRMQGQAIPPEALKALSPVDQRQIIKLVTQSPRACDLALLNALKQRRQSKIQRQALNALLQLDTSAEYQAAVELGKAFYRDALHLVGKRIHFDPAASIPFQTLPYQLEHVDIFSAHFANPLYRLLALTPLPSIFDPEKAPARALEICQEPALEKLCQLAVLSSAHHQSETWVSALADAWLATYPEGHTIAVDFGPVLGRLPSKKRQSLVDKIVKNEEHYFFEVITRLLDFDGQYLNLSISKLLVQRLLEEMSRGMSHHDKQNLKRWLPKGAYILDPRVIHLIDKRWDDLDFYYDGLSKPLWKFRNTLQQRFDLFSAISKP